MRLGKPLLQLPICFDAERLAAEVNALPPSAWMPHPQRIPGNEAVPLVSAGGGMNDDLEGAMVPTEQLERCPYIMALMGELDGVWGRSRLMGLAAGSQVPPHVDVHYYWRTHLRIHIPVITNPGVLFTCDGETVHMAPGECWVFDSFAPHDVQNTGSERRIHLVLDTVGNEHLWDLVEQAYAGAEAPREPWLPDDKAVANPLAFERWNIPNVMSPWEIRQHLGYILEHALPHEHLEHATKRLDRFATAWEAAWSQYGNSDAGFPVYRRLIDGIRAELKGMNAEEMLLRSRLKGGLLYTIENMIFYNAVRRPDVSADAALANHLDDRPIPPAEPVAVADSRQKIERPVFLVSSPRSGSTLLFETLAQAPGLHSPGGESHLLIENIDMLSVPAHGWTSNRLTADDAEPGSVNELAEAFYRSLRDRDGRAAVGTVRMLEKTPKNALRVPFFNEVWPDSLYVFLYRDPRQTISSMIEAWMSGGFRTYPTLPGWSGHPWSLLLVPGWRELKGLPLPEIAARQWKITMETLLDDLSRIPTDRVRSIDYDDFVAAPEAVIKDLASSLGLEWDRPLGASLPLSKTTVSRPGRAKWRRIESLIQEIWPIVEEVDERAKAFVESTRATSRTLAA
jgi:hypothetical protein